MSFFNGISMWTSVIFGVEKLKQLFSCKEEIILWAMDAICSFTQHVTLNCIIRRVICILVILSLGNSIQVSEFYSNLWHNFYFVIQLRPEDGGDNLQFIVLSPSSEQPHLLLLLHLWEILKYAKIGSAWRWLKSCNEW